MSYVLRISVIELGGERRRGKEKKKVTIGSNQRFEIMFLYKE